MPRQFLLGSRLLCWARFVNGGWATIPWVPITVSMSPALSIKPSRAEAATGDVGLVWFWVELLHAASTATSASTVAART